MIKSHPWRYLSEHLTVCSSKQKFVRFFKCKTKSGGGSSAFICCCSIDVPSMPLFNDLERLFARTTYVVQRNLGPRGRSQGRNTTARADHSRKEQVKLQVQFEASITQLTS